MVSIKRSFVFLLVIVFPFIGITQNEIHNSLLIQVENGVAISEVLSEVRRNTNLVGYISNHIICQEPYKIYRLDFDDRNENLNDVITFLSKMQGVEKAQYNHKLEFRGTPNDPKFSSQWSLVNTGQTGGTTDADIDADLAWEKTTGGLTPSGDTIVICIIDSGIDGDHEDIVDNLWINHGEIPNNGIDDDGNGYIDDYKGWNPVLGNDDIEGGAHGMKVAGIIGAKGDNGIGIAGINWNVKLLVIPMSGEESDVIEGYVYVYKMRKMYNESNGTKGAFIVATNNSFGLNERQASEFPIWCSMYDLMGSVGVVSVGATANINTNVDQKGDMPSTCPSDFLISVTNMDKYNRKYTAGYGKVNIDLGAYGENTFSTTVNNDYIRFGGTSAATPHVTGVVGLIYSYSNLLGEISKEYPYQAALMVKEAILRGGKHNETLENITVSESVLNANNSLDEIALYESDCAPPVKIVIDSVGSDLVILKWDDAKDGKKYDIKYKRGNEDWNTIGNVESPYTFYSLNACEDYQFSIKTDCEESEFGYVFRLKTDGCCDIPVIVDSYTSDSIVHVEWSSVLAAENYEVRYKYWSLPFWNNLITNETSIDINNYFDCGQLLFSVKSNCIDSASDISEYFVLGNECQACDSIDYCDFDINNGYEWIDSFSINDFGYKSGKDENSFGDYSKSKSIKLNSGDYVKIKTVVAYENTTYDDFLYLWIDLDRDGVFSSEELLAVDSTQGETNFEFDFVLPSDLAVGETHLRLLLIDSSVEDACDDSGSKYGEYEDYCVYLDTINTCIDGGINIDTVSVEPYSVGLKWSNLSDFPYFNLNVREENDSLYELNYLISDTSIIVGDLDSCTDYIFELTSYCSEIEKGGVSSINIKTDCNVSTNNVLKSIFYIYPNPLDNTLFVGGLNTSDMVDVEIFNLVGKSVYHKKYKNSFNGELKVGNILNSGIYIIKVKSENSLFMDKIIKL